MVKHILADGREVDSIEGFVVPCTGATESVYRIVAEFHRNHPEIMYQKREGEQCETK